MDQWPRTGGGTRQKTFHSRFFTQTQEHEIQFCQRTKEGMTPFYFACQENRASIAQLIYEEYPATLETPYRVDGRNGSVSATTPFWNACQKGNIDVVRYLVEETAVDKDVVVREPGALRREC